MPPSWSASMSATARRNASRPATAGSTRTAFSPRSNGPATGTDDVDTVIANIDNPKPIEPWSYWNPSLQLSLWFVACLDAIEAGVITADQIPPESGLNTEVVAALTAVEECDLSDQWVWHTAP